MRIGIDVHGVADTHTAMYAKLAEIVIRDGGQVHIITGVYLQDQVKVAAKLHKAGLRWTHWFSIPDHHQENNEASIEHMDNGHFVLDSEVWDRTKADYCRLNGIDLMIDDSPAYGRYFNSQKTVFLLQKDPSCGALWDRMLGE